MSPPAGNKNRAESGLARLLGSGTSGVLELIVFHPVDTIAKRLMTNPKKVSFLFFLPLPIGNVWRDVYKEQSYTTMTC